MCFSFQQGTSLMWTFSNAPTFVRIYLIHKSNKQVLTGLRTDLMKYVFRPAILKASSRFSPNAGSTSNSPCRKLKVFSEMWTRLLVKTRKTEEKEEEVKWNIIMWSGRHQRLKPSVGSGVVQHFFPRRTRVKAYWTILQTYPAFPLDSILFASSTSFEYTSYCHWRWPRMPAKIAPVWMPTRISTGELVFCWTYLHHNDGKIGDYWSRLVCA